MMLRHITVGPIGFDHQIQHLDSFIYVFQHDDIGFDSENIHLLPYVHHIRILSQWKCHWSRWHHYLELYTLTVYKLLCGTSEAKRHRDHCVCRPSVRPRLSVLLSSFVSLAQHAFHTTLHGLINFRPIYVLFFIFMSYIQIWLNICQYYMT